MNEEDKEKLAAELLDEALAAFGKNVPPELLAQVRMLLEAELLSTKHGSDLLRRAAPDPEVGASGAVAKDGAVESRRARKASGEEP